MSRRPTFILDQAQDAAGDDSESEHSDQGSYAGSFIDDGSIGEEGGGPMPMQQSPEPAPKRQRRAISPSIDLFGLSSEDDASDDASDNSESGSDSGDDAPDRPPLLGPIVYDEDVPEAEIVGGRPPPPLPEAVLTIYGLYGNEVRADQRWTLEQLDALVRQAMRLWLERGVMTWEEFCLEKVTELAPDVNMDDLDAAHIQVTKVFREHERVIKLIDEQYQRIRYHTYDVEEGADVVAHRQELRNYIMRIRNVIKYCFENVLGNIKARMFQDTHTAVVGRLRKSYTFQTFGELEDMDLKDIHKLTWLIVQEASERGYRKYRGKVYEEIFIPYEGQQIGTYAWEYVRKFVDSKRKSTIETFIHDVCNMSDNPGAWYIKLNLASKMKVLVNELSKGQYDASFPTLRMEMKAMAFKNGLYFLDEGSYAGKFVAWSQRAEIPQDTVALVYHPCDFPEEDYTIIQQTLAREDSFHQDPLDIDTPHVARVFKHQKLDLKGKNVFERDLVFRVIFMLAGRMFYQLRQGIHLENDTGRRSHVPENWQVIAFFKGVAGTGKSVFLELIQYALGETNCALLSTKIEAQFGLSAIYDSIAVFCTEVRDGFQLSMGELLQMIEGTSVQVAKKFELATKEKWTAPMMFSGNEVPKNWMDRGGEMTRRFVVVEFTQGVKEVDTRIKQNAQNNIGRFVLKCNYAYRKAVVDVGPNDLYHRILKQHTTLGVVDIDGDGHMRLARDELEETLTTWATQGIEPPLLAFFGTCQKRCKYLNKIVVQWAMSEEWVYSPEMEEEIFVARVGNYMYDDENLLVPPALYLYNCEGGVVRGCLWRGRVVPLSWTFYVILESHRTQKTLFAPCQYNFDNVLVRVNAHSVMGSYFEETSRNFKSATHTIAAFLNDRSHVRLKHYDLDMRYVCSFREFKIAANKYAHGNNLASITWNSDQYKPIFDEYGIIHSTSGAVAVNGVRRFGSYLLGLRLVTDDDDEDFEEEEEGENQDNVVVAQPIHLGQC
tara:strand:+ start:10473 stop:13469 length:2997 start_codon:yes stop_codon:yes gene_type:complete